GVYNLHPPTRFCLNSACQYVRDDRQGQQRALTHVTHNKVTCFTREFGPVPAVAYSMTCPNCDTRYAPAYIIDQRNKTRAYYTGLPQRVHIGTHLFLDAAVCERFTISTVCACARIYNAEHRPAIARFPLNWSVQPLLTTVAVSDAFFLYALLRNRAERQTYLVVESDGTHSERLDPLLVQRTESMVGPAREAWNHVCHKCCAVKTVDGVHPAVMDGIAIGHPCCGVHDCQEPLPSQRARFCSKHAHLNSRCAVIGCEADVTPGFQTCAEPSHRTIEDPANRSSLFVLRRRLERLKASSVEKSDDGMDATDELIEVDQDGECPSKSDEGNARPRARFGRRRTHNEQLVVATCGVVLGRATMFGSEGINGTRHHLITQRDTYFDHCALPVDPFHAKTKHKDSDTFCNQHCNAALFPDLLLDNKKWRFNSSAAEMTNAWLGGFQAMVREMRPTQYDFFLDEMILLRNRMIIDELRKAGANPQEASRESILGPMAA
ncbi:hypothetical protein C8T65DRAFT_587708, partial [Cerioporus squamosus]